MKKNFGTGIVVFIAILLVVGGLVFYALKLGGTTLSKANDTFGKYQLLSKGNEYIARLSIEGNIAPKTNSYDQQWILSTVKELKDDPKNLGILLYLNTPGGTVYESDELYLALLDYKAAGKKVIAYMGQMAASGGYYISCAADEIIANRNTLTGSIGVIAGQSMDLSGLLEKAGIKSETIHAGKNKNMGNYNEPLSDEQRAILQSVADECYEQFLDIVKTQRKLSDEKARELCDGRVYTAKQALENGLIDKIDSWENAITYFKKDVIANENCEVIELDFEREFSLKDLLTSTASDIIDKQAAAKLGIPENVFNSLKDPVTVPSYY